MRNAIGVVLMMGAAVIGGPSAAAGVVSMEIEATEPFAAGARFGDTGAYERVKGTFKGELDPADPRNKSIVNIDKAPRNAAGMVEYEADFFMLRPADAGARQSQDHLRRDQPRAQDVHWRLMDATLRVSVARATIRARWRMRATDSSTAWAIPSSGAAGTRTRRAREQRPDDETGDRHRRRHAYRARDPRRDW